MKHLYEYLKMLRLWAISCTFIIMIVLGCSSTKKDFLTKIENIKISKDGFLRLTTHVGSTKKSSTIYGDGYITKVGDSTGIYRIVLGEKNEYHKGFETKKEGDLIPIWYSLENDFVMEQIFKTKEETIVMLQQKMKAHLSIERNIIYIGIMACLCIHIMVLMVKKMTE